MSEQDHDHGSYNEVMTARVKALESLLTHKGLVDSAAVDLFIDLYETKIGPRNGAQVVARAWSDPGYKARLLADGAKAIAELGFSGMESEQLVVVENDAQTHNIVVCTLCSCYPWAVLGLPPTWYKSAPYRARVIKEPRSVLAEFGVALGEGVQVRVWDSTADLRYFVLPRRPEGSDKLDEKALADLVTRDGMIGTALV